MALFKKTTKAAAPKEVKKAPKAEKKQVGMSLLAPKSLIAPLVTEKTAELADQGVYTFRVPLAANRVAVREAFRELYKVTPKHVNVLRVHGKEKRFGGVLSRRGDWKKALVTVPAGTRVDIFAV